MPAETVWKMLTAAAKSSAEAPNRALKRRVRQRLHKKLGYMLGQRDFDEVGLVKSNEIELQ